MTDENIAIDYKDLGLKQRMLKKLGLAVTYIDGDGDYLEMMSEGTTKRVLDLVGSYGINLLGHQSVLLKNIKTEIAGLSIPNFIQGTVNPFHSELNAKLKEHLGKETGILEWEIEYANSGSEIVEAAFKICYTNYSERVEKIKQDFNEAYNYFHSMGMVKEKNHLESQLMILKETPGIIHIEGSYHGKTIGLMPISGKRDTARDIPMRLPALKINRDGSNLEPLLKENLIYFDVWDRKNNKWKQEIFLPVVALIFEPIQGESGVHVLNENLLKQIFVIAKTYNIPLICDEIQCGCYRAGYFSYLSKYGLIADVYCFGKALGGGIAKISALCCRLELLPSDFYESHAGSYFEDTFSTLTAIRVLDHLSEQDFSKIKSEWLLRTIKSFAKKYPDMIEEIRGSGLMISVSLNLNSLNTTFVSKYLNDSGLLGYWVASVMLDRESVRVFPSLSAPFSFRIQPSLYFTENDLSIALNAWSSLFDAIRRNDHYYLFGHLIPLERNEGLAVLENKLRTPVFPENAAVFLCHPIDNAHIRTILGLPSSMGDEEMDQLFMDLMEHQKFCIYHIDRLFNNKSESVPVVYLGIAITSNIFYQALRSGKRQMLIKKIQEAINLANHYHAKSIGLGQFTSIISQNGTRLKSDNAIITSGNSYTASLSVQAAYTMFDRVHPGNRMPVICIIGASGNIMKMMTLLFLKRPCKIILVYHESWQVSTRIRSDILAMLLQISNRKNILGIGKIVDRCLLKFNSGSGYDLNGILNDKELKNFIEVSNHPSIAEKANIIAIATNSGHAILSSEMISEGAIVIDTAVPSNVSEEAKQRPDVLYISGGMAGLPILKSKTNVQHLNSSIFPFGEGTCFACMAETFGIALSAEITENQIGELSLENVLQIERMMEEQGFFLKDSKTKNSY